MAAPFSRARAMFALVVAAMAAANPTAALAALAPYESRGKGGKQPHKKGNGSARSKRAATKARNVQRYKEACRHV